MPALRSVRPEVLALFDTLPLEETFVRASGPGGQNVNKVSTAVSLRLNLAVAPLPDDVKARLSTQAGRRLTRDGILVLEAREHRTQALNREAARQRLAELISAAWVAPRRRRPTRPSRASKERRIDAKKIDSRRKQGRAARPGDD